MRKLKLILAVLAASTLFSALPALATDQAFNASVLYVTPITITETSPWSMTLDRKAGTPNTTPIAALALSSASWTTGFASKPGQNVGCLNLHGEANTPVHVSIASPTSLSDGNGKNATFGSLAVEGKAVPATTGCDTGAGTGTYTTGTTDGTTPVTLGADNKLTVSWRLAQTTTVTLPDSRPRAYSGTGTVTVIY